MLKLSQWLTSYRSQFVFVIYFCVCGGAFGYEEAVGNAGPALTLLMTMLIPLVWCLPLAYITAELGTMYPESNEVSVSACTRVRHTV